MRPVLGPSTSYFGLPPHVLLRGGPVRHSLSDEYCNICLGFLQEEVVNSITYEYMFKAVQYVFISISSALL
jgi:hypothetical protein